MSENGDVRELNVLTPLPPLGLFDLDPYGRAVYTTSFTVRESTRLLLHTDGRDATATAQGRPFPLRDWVHAHGPCPPVLDTLVSDLSQHTGGEPASLRDEALLLLLQAEKHQLRHLTTSLHAPAATNHCEAPTDGDRAGG
ncbi:hypothetical protein GCM10010277_83300 [Streptomyces longisporoflavus]|nr:hypothetical protein GCM10010277_83300 [Streptomyces longisporoflavus]